MQKINAIKDSISQGLGRIKCIFNWSGFREGGWEEKQYRDSSGHLLTVFYVSETRQEQELLFLNPLTAPSTVIILVP